MHLPEFGVKKPITNLMIFCSIIILAGYSLTRLGIDSMPAIEPPVVSVITTYAGASPEDVEIKVTEQLENQLSTTPGIEKITSNSFEGVSVISLKFIWGTNLDEATNDIRDRIDRAKQFLPSIPDEIDNPFIFKFNTANIPVMFFGITAGPSYPELYDIVDKRIGDPLRQIPGVGTVQLQGGLERQINVWVDKQKLESYDISILDLINTIRRENVTQPVGSLKSSLTEYLVRLPGEFTSPDEINSVIAGRYGGTGIYLKDIARVEDGFKEVVSDVRINRRSGLLMMIQKQTGTNTVEVARRVKKKMRELEKVLPADAQVIQIFDTSQDIIDSLHSLQSSVWTAVVLVILVVWFFLRQFLPSAIVALTIPFSLLVTFVYLFFAGKTINSISLSSVAIASGMVVDNAIVIVDNIFRRIERGNRPQEAAIFGAQEMFLSVSASTMTTVVVFVPMLFIPGVVGIMFGELAMVVIVTLLASLFTASTFTPMLCSLWMKQSAVAFKNKYMQGLYDASERLFTSWENSYSHILEWALAHKKRVLIGFISVLVCTFFLVPLVGTEFAPEEDSGDLRLTVQLPVGTRLEETERVAKKIEDILKIKVPEQRFMYARIGQVQGIGRMTGEASGSHVIICGCKLVRKDERKRGIQEIARIVRAEIKKVPGVIKTNVSTGSPIGRLISGSGGKAIQINVVGHSFEETDMLAGDIKRIVEKIPGAVDVSISRDVRAPELRIAIDRRKAAQMGFTMTGIADTIKAYMQGTTASKFRERGKTYDIFVRFEEKDRRKIEDIERMSVISPVSGKAVTLANIAHVYESRSPIGIERQNRERVVRVEANVYKRSMGEVVRDARRGIRDLVIPAGLTIEFGGEADEQRKAFRDLFLLLLLGVALVYMVMAAQFESLLDPFIIMFAIPFIFTGVIWAFVITGVTLSIVSFLGVVMLLGIVVNNAIVLISYIAILRARGHTMREAVSLSGKSRLRPVLMTTITTLMGLLPLALASGVGSETWKPIGVTMIGGLVVSTLITMVFVPTLYAVFHRKETNRETKNRSTA